MLNAFFGPPAQKFLKKCDSQLYDRLIKRVNELEQNPFPQGVKRVEGKEEKMFRVRVGDYRILYIIYHEKNEILVTDIDKRPHAYD